MGGGAGLFVLYIVLFGYTLCLGVISLKGAAFGIYLGLRRYYLGRRGVVRFGYSSFLDILGARVLLPWGSGVVLFGYSSFWIYLVL